MYGHPDDTDSIYIPVKNHRPSLLKNDVRETNCVIHSIEINPVDNIIRLLNNWALGGGGGWRFRILKGGGCSSETLN